MGNQSAWGRQPGEVESHFDVVEASNPLSELFQMREFPHCRQIVWNETGTWKTKTLKRQPINFLCVSSPRNDLFCSFLSVLKSLCNTLDGKYLFFQSHLPNSVGLHFLTIYTMETLKSKQPAKKNVKSLSPLYIIHRTVMWMRWTSGIRFTSSLETLLIFCCLQEDVQLHSCVPANCTKSYSAHARGLHDVEKNIVFFFYKSQVYTKNKC